MSRWLTTIAITSTAFLWIPNLNTNFKLVSAYDNGVNDGSAIMGWSTWCTNDICGLRDHCSQYEVKKRADALVDEGMAELGYKWLLLDDCWAGHERDDEGNLQPSHEFPDGMKSLADYVHDKGLYLGLYTCVGTKTCKKNRPGSYGHYEQDAAQFASWGIDMVKADNCNHPDTNETIQELFTGLSNALNATGRPMLFSMCEWGNDEVWDWGDSVAQMYRISMDHLPFFQWPATAAGQGYGCGTAEIIEWMADLHPSKYVKRYSFMDPDFLETLFPKTMSFTHSRTEFTFWTLWAAPLMVSTEILNLDDEKKSILMNKEVIEIQKDSLFIAGERVAKDINGGQTWYRPMANGDKVVVLYNSNNSTSLKLSFDWDQIGWDNKLSVKVRDVWMNKDEGDFVGSYDCTVDVHDVKLIRMRTNSE